MIQRNFEAGHIESKRVDHCQVKRSINNPVDVEANHTGDWDLEQEKDLIDSQTLDDSSQNRLLFASNLFDIVHNHVLRSVELDMLDSDHELAYPRRPLIDKQPPLLVILVVHCHDQTLNIQHDPDDGNGEESYEAKHLVEDDHIHDQI